MRYRNYDDLERIIEPEDLADKASSAVREIEKAAPDFVEQLIEIHRDSLEGGLKAKTARLPLMGDLAASDQDTFEQFRNLFLSTLREGNGERINEFRKYQHYQHAYGSLLEYRDIVRLAAACGDQSPEILRLVGRAFFEGVRFGIHATYKPLYRKYTAQAGYQESPLFGPIPEPELTTPNSEGGRLELVINRAREIWGIEDDLPEAVYPEWKIRQADWLRLKLGYGTLFQHICRECGEGRPDWAVQSWFETGSFHYQLDLAVILKYARKEWNAGQLNGRITDAELFAFFAMGWAFDGLEALLDQEEYAYSTDKERAFGGLQDQAPQIERSLAEAEGFLALAEKSEAQVKEEQAKEKGVSEYQGGKSRGKDLWWTEAVDQFLTDKVKKEMSKDGDFSAQKLAKAHKDKVVQLRADAEKKNPGKRAYPWPTDFDVIQNTAKRIRKIRQELKRLQHTKNKKSIPPTGSG